MGDDRPRAEVRLDGGEVRVSGPDLAGARLGLFFRSVLGCRLEEGTWVCPIRGRAGADLVIRIASQLNKRGYAVTADGGDADLALKHEIERVRSFKRARAAGARYLELGGADPEVEVVDESTILDVLEEAGWDSEARSLRAHQRQGVVHAMNAINAANFSVPGAGKTATALAAAVTHLAQDHIDLVIVIGPLSCFRPWEREAALAAPGVFDVRRVRSMGRDARREVYRRADRGSLLLLSFATAAHDRPELERLCRRARVMLIVDESHRVKRFRGGQWAPALVEVARYARIKMILTGTPMPHGANDLWSQFNILWPGGEATGSRAAYAARADNSFPTVVDELAPFFIRTPKAELGLREPRFEIHPVEMPPTQSDVYELITQRLRMQIPDEASWQDKLDALRRARPIRLIQAASNPDLLNESDGFFRIPPISSPGGTLMERLDRYREIGELPAKFTWALGFLEDLKADNRKVVVWTSFIRNIDQFARLAKDRLDAPVFSVDGRVPAADSIDAESDELDETREDRIDGFLDEPNFAILIANPAACAESISLHSSCFVAVYLDRTHDCARWLQSIDRIHRLGLPDDIQVEIHIGEALQDGQPTVDRLIDQRLDLKRDQMQRLLEDAELRGTGLQDQDTLAAAEGTREDLEQLLRYLLGEE